MLSVITYQRSNFRKLFESKQEFASFKEYALKFIDEKPFRFIDEYFKLQDKLCKLPMCSKSSTRISAIDRVFHHFETNDFDLIRDSTHYNVHVKSENINSILSIYVNYLLPKAPQALSVISNFCRTRTAELLVGIIIKKQVNIAIFDRAMFCVLSKLHSILGSYLESIGYDNAEEFLAEERMQTEVKYVSMSKQSTIDSNSLDRSIVELNLKLPEGPKLARESFISTLCTKAQFDDFSTYVDESLNSESLLCYVTWTKIEKRLYKWAKGSIQPTLMAWYECRHSHETSSVPLLLIPLFYLFYQIFIATDAVHQINIPSSLVSAIFLDLQREKIPVHVFDNAISHVLSILYSNCFLPFADSYGKK